jgi:hypothetical protein
MFRIRALFLLALALRSGQAQHLANAPAEGIESVPASIMSRLLTKLTNSSLKSQPGRDEREIL